MIKNKKIKKLLILLILVIINDERVLNGKRSDINFGELRLEFKLKIEEELTVHILIFTCPQ